MVRFFASMLTQVGKYQIVEKIGVGGFGTVYKGRDPFIKRAVAIKTCQSDEEEIKKRFFREAEFAGNLHHRNITTIYDFGVTEEGVPYIVQEFLTGEDLDKMIKRKDPITLARKIRVLLDVCDGLGYAHAQGIIHRDIKPSNVRILGDDTVKLMDFGIAKSMVSQSTLTQTGITLGTASYLAPEQIRGEPVDPRTDIFSLGVLMYEVLTTQKPFTGDHISTVLYKILNESPPKPSVLDPRIPPVLDGIVMKSLEKNRDNRYASCGVLRAELLEAAENISDISQALVVGAPATETERTIATPTGGFPRTSMTTPPAETSPRPAPPPSVEPARYLSTSERLGPPGLSSGSVGDVRIRQEETESSVNAAPEPHGGSALGIFLGSLLVVVLLGGGAAWLYNRTPEGAEKMKTVFGANGLTGDAPTPAPASTSAAATPTAVPPTEPTAAPAPTAEPKSSTGGLGVASVSATINAEMTLDGQRHKVFPAPTQFRLKAGPHRAVFSAKNSPDITKDFEIRPGETATVRAEFADLGKMKVFVFPPEAQRDAEIRRDGKGIGKAPTEDILPVGTYRIQAIAPGFEPAEQLASVAASETTTVKIVMKKTELPPPNPAPTPAPAPAPTPAPTQ